MKRLLYFDPFNGISGDMTLGALIHLGVPLDHLKSELRKLELDAFELTAQEIERLGIRGVNFQVRLHEPAHRHHGHHHHEHHQPGQHSRGFRQIESLIKKSGLDDWVKEKSLAIFRRLAEAEAKVHGSTLEDVHFHEVGAMDAIVDIVGACIGFRYLAVDVFYSSPMNLGGGTVTFSHGTWPVPAPATAELVAGFPVIVGEVQAELTTPTGAAILTTLVEKTNAPPVSRFEKWGFGAGDREFDRIPNMLRLLLGTTAESEAWQASTGSDGTGWIEEEIYVLEANIDDMDAETFGHFLDLGLRQGALDVYFAPLHMKKNRPGLKLSVLCTRADRERMAELIFRETTTLGVRWSPCRRWILERETRQIQTEYGTVAVKIGRLKGQIVSLAPEYDDLKKIADATGIPLKTLRQKILENIVKEGYE